MAFWLTALAIATGIALADLISRLFTWILDMIADAAQSAANTVAGAGDDMGGLRAANPVAAAPAMAS